MKTEDVLIQDGKVVFSDIELNLYSYYNKKGDFWTPPFQAGAIPVAAFVKGVIRTIAMAPEEAQKQHLDECDLYLVGTFNDSTGQIVALERPNLLLNCSSKFGGQVDA